MRRREELPVVLSRRMHEVSDRTWPPILQSIPGEGEESYEKATRLWGKIRATLWAPPAALINLFVLRYVPLEATVPIARPPVRRCARRACK